MHRSPESVPELQVYRHQKPFAMPDSAVPLSGSEYVIRLWLSAAVFLLLQAEKLPCQHFPAVQEVLSEQSDLIPAPFSDFPVPFSDLSVRFFWTAALPAFSSPPSADFPDQSDFSEVPSAEMSADSEQNQSERKHPLSVRRAGSGHLPSVFCRHPVPSGHL